MNNEENCLACRELLEDNCNCPKCTKRQEHIRKAERLKIIGDYDSENKLYVALCPDLKLNQTSQASFKEAHRLLINAIVKYFIGKEENRFERYTARNKKTGLFLGPKYFDYKDQKDPHHIVDCAKGGDGGDVALHLTRFAEKDSFDPNDYETVKLVIKVEE